MPRGTPGREAPKRERVIREIPSCLELNLLFVVVVVVGAVRASVPVRPLVIGMLSTARPRSPGVTGLPNAGSDGGEPAESEAHIHPPPPQPPPCPQQLQPRRRCLNPTSPPKEVPATPGGPSPRRGRFPPPPLSPPAKRRSQGYPRPLSQPPPPPPPRHGHGPSAVLTRRRRRQPRSGRAAAPVEPGPRGGRGRGRAGRERTPIGSLPPRRGGGCFG